MVTDDELWKTCHEWTSVKRSAEIKRPVAYFGEETDLT